MITDHGQYLQRNDNLIAVSSLLKGIIRKIIERKYKETDIKV